jgi:hypothetical protein
MQLSFLLLDRIPSSNDALLVRHIHLQPSNKEGIIISQSLVYGILLALTEQSLRQPAYPIHLQLSAKHPIVDL